MVASIACVCAQSYLTFCDPMDYIPPCSSVYGILQARILEWLPFPTPGDPLDSGIKPTSLAPPTLAGRFFTITPLGKPPVIFYWGLLITHVL